MCVCVYIHTYIYIYTYTYTDARIENLNRMTPTKEVLFYNLSIKKILVTNTSMMNSNKHLRKK